MEPGPLTYDLLDDLMLGRPESLPRNRLALCTTIPREIGPIIELSFQRRYGFYDLPSIHDLRSSPTTQALLALHDSETLPRRKSGTALSPNEVEFSRIPRANAQDAPRWIAFCKRFENAACLAGFPKGVSAGLTGAFLEMVDNALQHSDSGHVV